MTKQEALEILLALNEEQRARVIAQLPAIAAMRPRAEPERRCSK